MNKPPTVVLIHGLFGIRKLLWLEYFQGVPDMYREMGMRVIVPQQPWGCSIERRAAHLARLLCDESGPLHLVAHSMGGIDARAFINHHGGATRVASLTTLSSPHRGSAAADDVCASLSPFRLFPGVRDLTRPAMQHFNDVTPDLPSVIYRSYSTAQPENEQPWIVRHFGRIIQAHEGDNDSQVSVHSATLGEHIATLPCDHFEVMFRDFSFNPFSNRQRFDPMPIYRNIGDWILRQGH